MLLEFLEGSLFSLLNLNGVNDSDYIIELSSLLFRMSGLPISLSICFSIYVCVRRSKKPVLCFCKIWFTNDGPMSPWDKDCGKGFRP